MHIWSNCVLLPPMVFAAKNHRWNVQKAVIFHDALFYAAVFGGAEWWIRRSQMPAAKLWVIFWSAILFTKDANCQNCADYLKNSGQTLLNVPPLDKCISTICFPVKAPKILSFHGDSPPRTEKMTRWIQTEKSTCVATKALGKWTLRLNLWWPNLSKICHSEA